MKQSTFIHGVSIVAGTAGALALIGAWIAEATGAVFGFSQAHLWNDAIVLQLIAISGGVCALYRRGLEREEK